MRLLIAIMIAVVSGWLIGKKVGHCSLWALILISITIFVLPNMDIVGKLRQLPTVGHILEAIVFYYLLPFLMFSFLPCLTGFFLAKRL